MKHTTSRSNLVGNITAVEHTLQVPLDWSCEGSETIEIFVRELFKTDSPNPAAMHAVLFLQGGPGFPSPRPSGPPSGWMNTLLEKGYRVLLLDQRGTGRSTAMTTQRLIHLAETRNGVATQIEYLKNMRSDAIAADIDAVRTTVCGATSKVSLLGQSFGGFCMLSYMSQYGPHLDKCLFTCGLAPVTRSIREVYVSTYRRLLTRNKRFYTRYPGDVQRVREIVSYLHEHSASPILLPGGGHLTVRRFLQLGIALGSASGMDSLHHLLEGAFFIPPAAAGSVHAAVLSESFLYAVEAEQASFESSPIYWLLHESIYMNGGGLVSGWAAEEVMVCDEFRQAFDYVSRLSAPREEDSSGGGSVPYINFTGEMVYSWMGEDYARLRPLREAAHALAQLPWERALYDLQELADVATKNAIRCAALVSYDDMYVERTFSEETAALLGGEDVCKMWITNEFQHSGLRDNPHHIVSTLLKMTSNEIFMPS